MKKLLGLAALVLTLNAAAHATLIESDPSQNWMTLEATSVLDNSITWRFDYNTSVLGILDGGYQESRFFFADYIGDEDVALQTRQFGYHNGDGTYLIGGITGQEVSFHNLTTRLENWTVGTTIIGQKHLSTGWLNNNFTVTYNGTYKPLPQEPSTSVPEPSTVALLIGGLSMLGLGSLRRKQ